VRYFRKKLVETSRAHFLAQYISHRVALPILVPNGRFYTASSAWNKTCDKALNATSARLPPAFGMLLLPLHIAACSILAMQQSRLLTSESGGVYEDGNIQDIAILHSLRFPDVAHLRHGQVANQGARFRCVS
jgi:hypothetical protein